MDRPTTRPDPEHGAFLLPTRRAAIARCLARLEDGPVLLTGDSGIGKSWLWRRIEAQALATDRWIVVDLTPANGPNDLYRLIGHALGLDRPAASVETRIEIADHLVDRRADGHRSSLVIEEAHNLSPAVWEEVRVMANHQGRPDGFASILIVGQTPLARRLSSRSLSAVEARIAARVHLAPLDADEAEALLAHERPDRPWDRREVEAIHRDSAGNPRRMLRDLLGTSPPRVRSVFESLAHEPLTGPAKPPLRVEENLIEVGWSADEEPEFEELDESHPRPTSGRGADQDEAVQDRYAALQAWDEWSKNQARLASDPIEEDEEPASLLDELPGLRADVERPFAPFGLLFSRMTQAGGAVEPTERGAGPRPIEPPTSDLG